MNHLLIATMVCLAGLVPTGSAIASGRSGHEHTRGQSSRHARRGKKLTDGNRGKNDRKIGKNNKPANTKSMFRRLAIMADTNKNLTPAQRGALSAGLSGSSLSQAQRNALSELAAANGSGLSSEDREAINQLLEQDEERKDGELAADGDSSADAHGPVQSRRFLLLRNDSGEPLTIRVQFRRLTRHGEWNWFPADPRRSARALEYTIGPGKAFYLSDGESRVAASKVRIWAEGVSTGSRWEDYRYRDLWLVPEMAKDRGHVYHGDKIQTVTMRLTRPEDSRELLSAVARR